MNRTQKNLYQPTIRRMEARDLAAVCAIEKENFSTPWNEQGFRDFLDREDADFLVAVLTDADAAEKIVGYIGSFGIPDEGDITNVSVSPEVQGYGIGSRLVDALVQATAARGITRLFLEVRETNAGAIHLYEKAGFRQVGVRKNYYRHPTEDAKVMCREQDKK